MSNPYQPPEPVNTADEGREFTAQLQGATRSISTLSITVVVLGAVAYFAFTAVLLMSNGQDFKGGLLFLLNAPVFCVWGVMLYRNLPKHIHAGFAAAVVQVGIILLMFLMGIGNFVPVILINGCTVTPLPNADLMGTTK